MEEKTEFSISFKRVKKGSLTKKGLLDRVIGFWNNIKLFL